MPTTNTSSTPRVLKTCHFYFLNYFMKHWTILIVIGTQQKKRRKRLVLPTSP